MVGAMPKKKASTQGENSSSSFIVVAHVLENRDYLAFIESLLETQLSGQQEPPKAQSPVPISAFDDGVFFAHPRSGILVLSDSKELLSAALRDRNRNYSYLVNNDRLYRGIRDALGNRLLRGAGTFFWAREPHPLVKDISGSILFERDRIELKAYCDLRDGQLSILRQFLEPPPRPARWEQYLPYGTAAAVNFDDPASSRYLDFFGSFAGPSSFMSTEYGGLLLKLRQVPGLKQILVAATGYHSGVPNVMLGLWGDTYSLEKAFGELQMQFRYDRDVAIINNALQTAASCSTKPLLPKMRFPISDEGSQLSISDLFTLRYLIPEDHGLFDRYSIVGGKPTGRLEPEDLENSTYSSEVDGREVRFLLPPVTDNDILYRTELQGLDVSALKDNRYRMPWTTAGKIVWVCTDLSDLKALLGRRSSESLRTNSRFQEAFPSTKPLKLELYMNMDQVIDLGLLSPESHVTSWVKANLIDLRNHPAISLTAVPNDQHRLQILLSLVKRD